MVINNDSGWVAFEELRGPTEATTVITEPKFGGTVRKNTQRNSWNTNSTRPSASTNSGDPSRPPSAGLPPSRAFSLGVRSTKRLSASDSDKILTRQESSLSRSSQTEAREQSKPDVIQRCTVGSTSTTSSRAPATHYDSIGVRGRNRSPSPAPALPRRGRSRGRSEELRPTDKSLQNRARSSSRARSTTSARTSVSVPAKQERGRSSSRSRLPPASAKSCQRARSRSQSLTRVTSPVAASPAATNSSHTRRSRSGSRPPPFNPSCQYSTPGPMSDSNVGRNVSFGRPEGALITNQEPQRKGIMEKFFGDQVKKPSVADIGTGSHIRPRTLLAATVYHNTATNLWITTINTNQKGVPKNPTLANKYLKAFSFQTELEARESAIANAPPKMVPFSASPYCFLCEGKFAVFRRASHCQNCGVCICTQCSTHWSSKHLPDTYNPKNKTSVKICKSCDVLSSKFKQALLEGNHEEAVIIYSSGNVNLRTPFPSSSMKGEIMYPIHCAVQGGNLDVIRWLVEDHFCPIKLIRTGFGRKSKRGTDSLILTSKGRSVLSIALERLKVDVLRYLVVDCGVSVHESTDLKSALRALEAALITLPLPGNQNRPMLGNDFPLTRWDKASFDELSEPSSLGTEDYTENDSIAMKSHQSRGSRSDSVSICLKESCIGNLRTQQNSNLSSFSALFAVREK